MMKENNNFLASLIHLLRKEILEKVQFSFGEDQYSLRYTKHEKIKSEVHGRMPG